MLLEQSCHSDHAILLILGIGDCLQDCKIMLRPDCPKVVFQQDQQIEQHPGRLHLLLGYLSLVMLGIDETGHAHLINVYTLHGDAIDMFEQLVSVSVEEGRFDVAIWVFSAEGDGSQDGQYPVERSHGGGSIVVHVVI
jgi:hypothetical protein